MKCKQCNGELRYNDGIYVCEHCGNKYYAEEYYEHFDVFICYIENDSFGRRTTDSIIAQDIYHILSQNKISVFYARNSVSALYGDELKKIKEFSIQSAKVIILVGTQKQHFETLSEQYKRFFAQKTVIPVFRDINISDIPKDISGIQAVDYANVNARFVLTNAVCNVHGLKKNTDIEHTYVSKTHKRKRWIFVAGLVCIVLSAVVVAVLCPGLLLPNQPSAGTDLELSENSYTKAVTYMEAGEYIKAIQLLFDLQGYKDVDSLLYTLYSRYTGYYQDENNGITLHLQLLQDNVADIEITKKADDGLCKITESTQIQIDTLTCDFNDSENNHGVASIKLENEEIKLNVETQSDSSQNSFGNIELTFFVASKTDKPFAPQIDKETLLSFINTYTTLQDLYRKGYELEFADQVKEEAVFQTYFIKNTDILLATLNEIDTNDSYVIAITAPASIICPERIGKTNDVFYESDVLYLPDLPIEGHFLSIYMDTADVKPIEDDTMISFASSLSLGATSMDETKQYHLTIYQAMREYNNKYSLGFSYTEEIEYSDSYCIISVRDSQNNYPTEYYKIDNGTFQMENYVLENDPMLDDEPNIWCTECGYGFFITGVGIDGVKCPNCGTTFIP